MLATQNIKQVATDAPSVYAFHIEGGVGADELAESSRVVDEALDRHETSGILVILHDFGPADALSSISLRSLGTQARSASQVSRYAVVGAPPAAAPTIDTFDAMNSIGARTFDHAETDSAWDFVAARPAGCFGAVPPPPSNPRLPRPRRAPGRERRAHALARESD
jgi:dihydroxyacetone kinase DhaKLM complex PTS-EIIA-like component DhaM